MARRKKFPVGRPLEYDVSYYRHQVPGGMITTLQRHLKEVGAEHRFDAVLEEIVRVRAELGYPIMVTPYSQLVATQALLNIESRERYEKVPDEVIKYVLGRFGPPPAPIDPWVKERVLSLPRARELDVPLPEPTLEELRRTFGATISGEELLLRWALPADQVDAALARKIGHPASTGNNLTHPIAQLIAEVARKPSISYFHLEKDGIRLTLRRQNGLPLSVPASTEGSIPHDRHPA